MKRKIICCLLVAALCCGLCVPALGASPAVRAANALYTLGLFNGIGQHTDGSPIYALDRQLTRQEAVVLLIRLLGLEQAALTTPAALPFADVDAWASAYVALAHERGLVRGVSDTMLDAAAPMDERGWLTFLLRALGYSDVNYEDPWALANGIGLTDAASTGFTRASAVTLSLTALGLPCAGGDETLLQTLLQADAVTAAEIRDAGLTELLTRRSLSAKELSARCADAVFYLEVFKSERDWKDGQPSATASGFFVTPEGVAVTNYHAVKGTGYACITTNEGAVYRVSRVLFADEERDMAVLRVEPNVLNAEKQPTGAITAAFPFLKMRSAETVVNGDIVYAIGSPLGLMNSISDGIVANRSRTVPGTAEPYIQITAAISSGSSGGALLNEYGEVIGITTATFVYGQNLNLARPLDPILPLELTAEGTAYEDSFEVELSPYAEIATYERYPAVPDYGAVAGTPLLSEGETENGWFYIYANADEDNLAAYYLAMSEWGFAYAFDTQTQTMIFTGDGLTVSGSSVELDGETYYRITVTEEVADTALFRTDVFPFPM